MLHLGDITKISGYTAPIVDVVVGGSPCQDLSVAGKRAGLDGERSGLFMEQLRIIKEMRESDRRNGRTDESIRPRYMVWENVPGAFSSNKAEDFRIVLEETAKVKDPQCSIPMPPKGKWTTAGCVLGDGWSIAWRVCDAQFWGVPQRRRRIALVADFGGHSAPEILFVRKSVSRDTEPSQPKGKETPTDASRGIGTDDIFCIDGDKLNKKERKGGSGIGYRDGDKQYTLTAKDVHGVAYCFEPGAAKRLGGYVWEDLAPTLRTEVGDNRPSVAYTLQDREGKAGFAQTLFQPVVDIDQQGGKGGCNFAKNVMPTICSDSHGTPHAVCYSIENHPADSRVDIDESGKVQTLTSRMGTGGGNVPMVMECYSKSKRAQSDTDYETWKESDVANTLNAFDVGDKRTTEAVVYVDTSKNYLDVEMEVVVRKYPVDCRNATEDSVNGALQSNMAHSLNGNNVVRVKYIVRRLTPLECERLQGYPDGWTDIGEWTDSKGKVHKTSDAARYKALGNSIALPPWKWVMKRLSACYERDATLASLFDGISGFCLIWTQLNGPISVKWTSEIEDFPIAVCKKHFGDEKTGEEGDLYEAIQSKK